MKTEAKSNIPCPNIQKHLFPNQTTKNKKIIPLAATGERRGKPSLMSDGRRRNLFIAAIPERPSPTQKSSNCIR